MIEKFNFSSKAKGIFIAIGAIGLVLIIIGGATGKGNQDARFWANYLLCNFYFLSFSVIAVAWMSIQYLAKASWATVLKRIVEAISGYMIVGIVATLIFLIASKIPMGGKKMGMYSIYSWLKLENPNFHDTILEGKRVLLNYWAYAIITMGLLAIWYYARQKYRNASLKEDQDGGLEGYNKQSSYSAYFLPFFGLSFCLFVFEMLMSCEPKWFSTMYAVNIFIGGFVSTITTIMFIAVILKKNNYLSYVNNNHFHDLGKFMFGFSIFWTYTWLAQFLLIWYANMNDEIVYFLFRMHGPWAYLFWSNIIINFLLPFLGLMMREAKRQYNYLVVVGCLMLVGRYIDWYLAIMPGTAGRPGIGQAGFGFYEIGFFMLFAGMFAYTVAYKLSKANLVPVNHPFLEESFHHEI